MSSSTTTPIDGSLFGTPYSDSPASSVSDVSIIDPADVDDALLSWRLSKINLKEIQQTLTSIAYVAGDMMLAADPSVDTSEIKANSSDRVTKTDKAIEDMVKDRLRRRYPDFEFLGEETLKSGQTLSLEPTFVCDPIDGTLNFIHGMPNFAISLALTVAKRPVVGVVYNSLRRELFTAIKGKGAYLRRNDGPEIPLPTKQAQEPLESLKQCLIGIELGKERYGPNWDLRMDVKKQLLSSEKIGGAMCQSVRVYGSCALSFCYVAAGWIDMLWESGCLIWDVCAGWLIVEEAGGIVVGANPGEWEPTLEGRSYFPVRAAPSGQEKVAEQLWSYMGERKFTYP